MVQERYITEDEMLALLLKAYAQDPEENMMWRFTQAIADPVHPVTAKGKRRLHPILLILIIVILITAALLVYLGQMRI